ncbi:LuxR C-terminal-related transcriptional regulator [Nocardia mexicana]|uniref:LuxR family maltose regulon positive regulatory protein n=1 Tax=Nocardia mexicana TaxID=279262 RepID=A0A370H127_9NOCA|nr:LuxR C-terminal-related transcriptional regulator [Nocardia mexicana]RDI49673.1 LuxR family maltose regulon positive regulatory protein [Nocardia mexicana]
MKDSSVSSHSAVPRFAFTPIPRPELYVRIDGLAGPGGHILLITGAAGAGKTVLIAQWAGVHLPRARPTTRVGWVTASRCPTMPGLSGAVAAALGLGGTTHDGPDTAAAQLISELGTAGHPVVLVIDDAHALTEPAAIAYLQRILTDAPANLTAVISGRHAPPLRWHAVDLHRRVFRLHATDLAFSDVRAAQLCREQHCAPEGAELAMLMGLTRGWPALVRIAAGLVAAHDDRATALTELAEPPAPIAQFLTDEVLAPLPQRIRRFVRTTSVPDAFTAPLAGALAGEDAVPILHELIRLGFPMTRLARDGDLWFTFHPLLRAHLLAEARRSDDLDALHLGTADCYLSAGMPRSALHHLLRVPASPELPAFLRDNAIRMVLAGHGADLFRQLDGEPGRADDPLLRALRAVDALERRDVAEAIVHLDLLYRRRTSGETIAPSGWTQLLAWAAAAGIALATGVGLAEFRLPEPVCATGQPDIDGYAAVEFGTVLLSRGNVDAAERQFRRGLAMADCAGNAPLRLRAAVRLATTAVTRGTAARMREFADLAVVIATRHGLDDTPEAGRAQLISMYARYLRGQPVDRRIVTAAAARQPGQSFEVIVHLLEFDLADDRFTAAETLRRATVVLLRTPLALPAVADRLLPHIVRVLLDVDATHSARLLIEQAGAVLGSGPTLARAVTALADRPGTARTLIEPLLATADAARPLPTVSAWLVEAVAQAAQGNPRRAHDALARAVRYAAPDHLVRPFLDVPGAGELLDAHIGTLGHDNDFAATVRRHPALHRRHRPPGLTATELTVLNLLPSGRTAQQIADLLGVSINTVKTHLHGIYTKLGTSSRAGALDLARRSGLL